MNTATHTPGPWEVVGSRICTVANDKERITLAKTEPGGSFAMSEQQEANAHLIAAAPAMYEALRSIPDHALDCKHSYPHTLACWNCIVKAALAQAEGRHHE